MNTLYIVDDHPMLKNGLKLYLEANTSWKVTGTFSRGVDCLEHLQKTLLEIAAQRQSKGQKQIEDNLPDIIIVDIQLMNDESGFTLVQKLRCFYPNIKIVMYSMYDTWGFILQAKDLGVQGYISKIASDEELVKCLECVKNGGTWFEKKSESIQNELDSILPVLKNRKRQFLNFCCREKPTNRFRKFFLFRFIQLKITSAILLNLQAAKTAKSL